MEISKKEVLEVTGISYGQLYRWKREGLIPEEWFRKRPSKTGQETYLPRELILERIQFILGHKDSCSIEEMAGLLAHDSREGEFSAELMAQLTEIDADIRHALRESSCSRMEAALLVIVSRLYTRYRLTLQEVAEILSGCVSIVAEPPRGRVDFLALRISGRIYGCLVPENSGISFDRRISILERFQVDSIASDLALRYLRKPE